MLLRPETKTPATCRSYERVVLTILRHANRMQARGEIEPIPDRNLRLALTLLELESHVQPSTYRFYKAAVHHAIKVEPGEMDAQILEILEPEITEDHTERQHAIDLARQSNLTTLKCAQQRAEHLPAADWVILINALLGTKSKWGRPAAVWLVSTMKTGLRPCEWSSACLTGTSLVVQNGKATNGRAFGKTRTLDLFRASKETLAAVEEFLAIVQSHGPMGYAALYRGVRELIADVGRRALSPRDRYPSIYTARHAFASSAKLSFPQHVVAALMGHASVQTAPRHYASARFARGGRPLEVTPSPQDVEAVTRLNAARAAMAYIGVQGERS